MNADFVTPSQWAVIKARGQLWAAFDLTFAQIRALPETTDCPPEERFS